MMMDNYQKQNVRDALTWLRENAEMIQATQFDMEEYGYGIVDEHKGEIVPIVYIEDCNTPSCLLGWMAHQAFDTRQDEWSGMTYSQIRREHFGMGFTGGCWNWLFSNTLWTDTTVHDAIDRLTRYVDNDFSLDESMHQELDKRIEETYAS